MDNQSKQDLLSTADQCVKCGQCLSVCPTYNLYENEAESARGRITLIQGLINGQLEQQDETTLTHLDHCLYCGNCEAACPSGVNYLALLDYSKQLYPTGNIPRWQLDFLTSKKLLKAGTRLSSLIPRSLSRLLPELYSNSIALRLPQQPIKVSVKQSKPSNKHKVGIFTGCIGSVVDNKAIQLTSGLLESFGYEVIIPENQVCCGAMYQHEGHLNKARQLAEANQQVFSSHGVEQVIYFASGCGSHLLKQQGFSITASDAAQFLSSLPGIIDFRSSLKQSIAIHKPCTTKNTNDDWDAIMQLVRAIAGDQLYELPENDICCGSAGLHLLKYPQSARQLLAPKLEFLEKTKPDILLTSNTGCSLHFYNGIIERDLNIRIMHPAEWISELFLQTFDENQHSPLQQSC